MKTSMPQEQRAAWLALIQEDRDWDWSFLVKLLLHKLRGMHEFFLHKGHCDGDKKIARDIGQVIAALERVVAEDYPGDLKKADRAMQRDLDKALGLISKHLFTWWD